MLHGDRITYGIYLGKVQALVGTLLLGCLIAGTFLFASFYGRTRDHTFFFSFFKEPLIAFSLEYLQ